MPKREWMKMARDVPWSQFGASVVPIWDHPLTYNDSSLKKEIKKKTLRVIFFLAGFGGFTP